MKTMFLSFAMVMLCPVSAWALFGIKVPDVLGSSVTCEVCQKELTSFEKNDKRLVDSKRCAQHRDLTKKCETCSNAWIPVLKTTCEDCGRKQRTARLKREDATERQEEERQQGTCVVCQKKFPSFEMQNDRCGNHRDLVNKCTVCSNVWLTIFKTVCDNCTEKQKLAKKQAEEAERRETERREAARQDELRRDKPFQVAFTNGSVFAKGSAEFEAVFDALSSHGLPYRLHGHDLAMKRNGERKSSLRFDEEIMRSVKNECRGNFDCEKVCVFQNALPKEDAAVTNLYPVLIGASGSTIAVFYACAKPASSFSEQMIDKIHSWVRVCPIDVDRRVPQLFQDLRPEVINLATKCSYDALVESLKSQVVDLCRKYLKEEKLAADSKRRKKASDAYLEVQERLKSQTAETAPFASAIEFAAKFFDAVERGDDDSFPTMFLRVAVNDNSASRMEVAMGMLEFSKTIGRKKLFPSEDNAKFVFYVDPRDYHFKQKDPVTAIVHVFVKVGDLYDYCGDLCLSKWKKEWKVRDWRPNDEFTDILDYL